MNVEVHGPKILFEIPILGGISVSETIVNSWIVMAVIVLACYFLGRNLSVRNPGKRQLVAEKIVIMITNLVKDVMGERNAGYAPYIGTLLLFSALSSLSSLTGLRPPTADLATTLAWALVTFIMVQVVSIRHHGVGGWLKGFTQPIALMTPLNVISEVANPISMAFRHFGNIASGVVITSLVYSALAALSGLLLGWIPNDFVASIPLFQVGLPAILSIYFDLFTSCLQAYIFCMLTMVFVSGAQD
ncbi:MAG: F0F1 ATP synthase subunit A [Clostridia bacterium]